MLQIQDLHMTYKSDGRMVQAVRGVSFEAAQGEFFTLLGPSGCGKTTTLRCVAGLETPTAGRISIGSQLAYSSTEGVTVGTSKRPIGMVFQSYAIWPHMTVFENVAFGLKYGRTRTPREELEGKVMRALTLVHLQDLAHRPAPQLSGGQQQRVALARALATEPELLLLDEPLSNLDAKLREEMRVELKDLVKRLNITTLYVTHDQVEAMAMSDRVAVMSDGVILQLDAPEEVYLHPNNEFTARFLGKANIWKGKIKLRDEGGCLVETSCGSLLCSAPESWALNTEVLVVFRPEAVALEKSPTSKTNTFPGRIISQTFLGDSIEYVVQVRDEVVQVKSGALTGDVQGNEVYVHLPPARCYPIQDGAPA